MACARLLGALALLWPAMSPVAAADQEEKFVLTTYYPVPSGVYQRLITTGETVLGRENAKVVIGGKPRPTGGRLDLYGGVTIGGPSEGIPLRLLGPASGTDLRFELEGGGTAGIRASGPGAPRLQFLTGGATPRMTITSDGKVGIGTEIPQANLEVSGAAKTGDLSAGAATVQSLNVAGTAAFSGTIQMNQNRIHGLADAPEDQIAPNDAVNKTWVLSKLTGLKCNDSPEPVTLQCLPGENIEQTVSVCGRQVKITAPPCPSDCRLSQGGNFELSPGEYKVFQLVGSGCSPSTDGFYYATVRAARKETCTPGDPKSDPPCIRIRGNCGASCRQAADGGKGWVKSGQDDHYVYIFGPDPQRASTWVVPEKERATYYSCEDYSLWQRGFARPVTNTDQDGRNYPEQSGWGGCTAQNFCINCP